MVNKTKVLETERLNLRELIESDAEFMVRLLNEPSYIKNIGDRNVRTAEHARKYISEKFITSYKVNGYGLYLVELKKSGEPIGISGLVKRDIFPEADVGFALLPKYWSQGYALESARGVLEFAKKVLLMKRVLGITKPENTPSIKLLENLGLKFEGKMKLTEESPESNLYGISL